MHNHNVLSKTESILITNQKMVTELFFFVPLCVMSYLKIIDWKFTGLLMFSVYWLPKCFFVKSLNHMYPSVLTHQKNNDDDTNTMKQIALTFDDVPYYGTKNLEKLVALLDKHNMKGTFFVISDYASDVDTKKILVEIVKNGHQLANHGKTNSMHLMLSQKKLEEEIIHCDHLIKEIYFMANVELPRMFYRPGCGAFNQRVIDLAESHNYTLALGSVYPNDPVMRFSWINYHYIVAHLEKNDVVIMHDREWTPKMLEMLLEYMKKESFKSVTLSKL